VLSGEVASSLVSGEVLAVTPQADGALVSTSEGDIHTARVLVCAGIETDLLARSCGVELALNKALHARVTFEGAGELLPTGLAFVDSSERYGVPVYGGSLDGRHVVIGLNGVGADLPMTPGSPADGDVVAAQVSTLEAYAAEVFPHLRRRGVRRCVTTALDGEPGDAFGVWDAGPVSFFAGNNLFKFAPALGQLLAHRLVEEQLDLFFQR
jgi:sarcosine oxidase